MSDAPPEPQPPSPEDNIILSHVGIVITTNIVATVCNLFAFGIFTLFSAFALTFLLRKRLRSRAQKVLFILSIYLTLSYTSFISVTISEFILSIRPVLQSNFDLPLIARLEVANLRVVPLVKYLNWVETLNVLCGDLVVVWRAWTIWNADNLYVNVSLIITMLANLVLNIYSAASYNPLVNDARNTRTGVAAMFLSFVVNALATSLIYLRAWTHRRMKETRLGHEKNLRKSDVDRILLLIIESGAVYCAAQLIYPVLNAKLLYTPDAEPGGGLVMSVNVFGAIYSAITVIYPMAVIILIHTRRSVIAEVTSVTLDENDAHAMETSDSPSNSSPRMSHRQRQGGILSTLRFAPSNSLSTSTGTGTGTTDTRHDSRQTRTNGTDVELPCSGNQVEAHDLERLDSDEVVKVRV
ncbi:hypothetical protein D9758_008601 [Tetrapyrgos nigripes]|uniref:Uncharacterized protein n=1 Tax=Tetrapyrgos nigripes TaxID=182062 RepID=A0A8H5G5R4_9AGAR|nr:hypothetical protein D9758_008601 [Tetrapyrgos nigripes]